MNGVNFHLYWYNYILTILTFIFYTLFYNHQHSGTRLGVHVDRLTVFKQCL